MRIFLIALLCLSAFSLYGFPIQRFDYHTPDHNPSPVVTAMGGLNLTDNTDYYMSYDNPALLAYNRTTSAAASFSVVKNDKFSPLQLMQVGTLLRNNQFAGLVFNTSTGAMMYQSVANIHLNEQVIPGYNPKIYFDYTLQKVQMSFGGVSDKNQNFAAGLTVKYLFGRLVYLSYDSPVKFESHEFFDDKVKGISSDLGFAYKTESVRVGLVFYDLLNGLFWQTESNKSLTRRSAFGIQFGQNDLKVTSGVMTTLEKNSTTTYHFGLAKDVSLGGSPINRQSVGLRLGAYSDKFSDQQHIFYSVGSGYYFKTFRIDFSIVGPGLKIEQCNYLISASLSM